MLAGPPAANTRRTWLGTSTRRPAPSTTTRRWAPARPGTASAASVAPRNRRRVTSTKSSVPGHDHVRGLDERVVGVPFPQGQLVDGLDRDRRRDDGAAADVDLHVRRRLSADDLHHSTLEDVARAELHQALLAGTAMTAPGATESAST